MDMNQYSHTTKCLVANKGSSAHWKLWRGPQAQCGGHKKTSLTGINISTVWPSSIKQVT